MGFLGTINYSVSRRFNDLWFRRRFVEIGSNLTVRRGLFIHPIILGKVIAKDNLTLISWIYPVVLDANVNSTIEIGNNVIFNNGAVVTARVKVVIGDGSVFGPMSLIMDSDGHGIDGMEEKREPVVIGKHVWVGAYAIILKGVTVGDNAIIGARSVVTRDVEANTIVAGNPARRIRDTKSWR